MKFPLIALGGFFVTWGIIGFVIPIADNGWSPMTFDNLCQIDYGDEQVEISNAFGPCQVSKYLIVNNYAYIGVGAALIFTSSLTNKLQFS